MGGRYGACALIVYHSVFAVVIQLGAILAVGMVTAFAVSIFVIKFLMGYIKKHDFKAFGWYRIALGAVVIAYFAISALTA